MGTVFLILSTDNIGGAEKRFFGLWTAIAQLENSIPCKLVLTPKLYQALEGHENSRIFLEQFSENAIQYDLSGGFKNFRAAIEKFAEQHTASGDILHFIGDHPLLFSLHRKQVFSITQSSLKNLNLQGRAGQFGGVWLSNIIDVLDPTIYQKLRKSFPFKKKSIFRTSNSFCDVDLFSPLPFEQKRDWLVFLGRFESMKQSEKLLGMVPAMYHEIKDKVKKDLHFYFFGYGSLEAGMKQKLQTEEFSKLPITVGYHDKPHEVLAQSKIFFSVQLHNNYPSKSLIEAMSAGNLPLVTDTGQTRWLAKPEFSYYVPEHFTEADMLKVLSTLYNETDEVLASRSAMARKFVMDEHTLEKMRDYYLDLYSRI